MIGTSDTILIFLALYTTNVTLALQLTNKIVLHCSKELSAYKFEGIYIQIRYGLVIQTVCSICVFCLFLLSVFFLTYFLVFFPDLWTN